MAQLVGQNCVRCHERISSILDGRFCPECRSPVHDRCRKRGDALGCTACGASVSSAAGTLKAPARNMIPKRVSWPLRLWIFLAAYYSLAIVWGVRSISPREPSPLDLLMPFWFAVALGWWAIADDMRRQRSIPLLARPWFVLFAFALVPGYVVWSRRWHGVGWVVFHAVCWFLLSAAAMLAAGTVVYGERWWRAVN